MAQEKALLASACTIFGFEQAQVRFGEVIDMVQEGQEQVVVEKDGIPVAVILSFPDWKLLLREVKLARFLRFSLSAGLEAERQGLTEEQLEQEMEKIRERVHQEVYG